MLVEWDVDTATGVRRRIWSGGFALEGGLEGVDGMSWALGEIGEGAFADFAVFPVGLAQEDGGRGVSVRDSFDIHGHIMILTVIIIK